MAKLISFLLLGLVASATAQQECSKTFGGRLFQLLKSESLPGCFQELTLSNRQSEVMRGCFKEVESNSYDIKSIKDLFGVFYRVAQCELINFDLISDDQIDSAKVLNEIDEITGPSHLKTQLKNIMEGCFSILTDVNNPVEKLASLMECKVQGMFNYCSNSPSRDPGYFLSLAAPLRTLREKSQCDVINMTPVVQPIYKACLAELNVNWCDNSPGDYSCDDSLISFDVNSYSRAKRSSNQGPRNIIENFYSVIDVLKCMDAKLGYTDANGIFYPTKFVEILKSFPGYSKLPKDIDTKLVDSVYKCYTGLGGKYPPAMLKAMPWLYFAQDDYLRQAVMFTKCLLPKYTEVCGLRNELAFFLFPMYKTLLPGAVVDEVIKPWGPIC